MLYVYIDYGVIAHNREFRYARKDLSFLIAPNKKKFTHCRTTTNQS